MKPTLAIVFLISCVSLACSPGSGSSIVAHYGDEVIRVDEFQRMYRMSAIDRDAPVSGNQESVLVQKRQVLDELITHRLLLDQARRQGIEIDVDQLQDHLLRMRHGYDAQNFKEQLARRGLSLRDWEEMQQERFLVQEWIQRTVTPALRITAADIKATYQEHREEFVSPERVRALHIVVPTREQAEKVKGGLAAGEDFAKLAKELSHGPEADRGGDLGYFARNETLPLFAEICFELVVGESSDIVASDYGFHIFKVVDKQRRQKKSLAEAEAEIRQRLHVERVRETTRQYVMDLRNRLDIKINDKVLMEVQ